MNKRWYFFVLCLTAAGVASAEDFDAELTAVYWETDVSAGSLERDFRESLRLSGSWFYDGLSDDNGPRNLAAFTDRASSLEYQYGDDDRAVFGDITGAGLSARHVWRDSGWFLTGTAFVTNIETEVLLNDGPVSFDGELDRYSAGVGRYVLSNTTVELGVIHIDSTFNSADTFPYAKLRHLGEIDARYSYGFSFDMSTLADSTNETLSPLRLDVDAEWRLGGSLYVGKDLSVDIGYSGYLDPAFSDRISQWSLGVGYFITPNVSLAFQYRRLTDEPEQPVLSPPFGPLLDQDYDTMRFATRIRF